MKVEKIILAAAITALLVFLCACSIDNEDPFGMEEAIDLSWPSLDPDRYHWNGFSNPFFEFWSWHVVIPEEGASFTLTMGAFNPASDDPDKRGAMVRLSGNVLDAPQQAIFSIRDFGASVQIRDVTVGKNRGTQNVIYGAINDDIPITFDFQVEIDQGWEDTMGMLTNISLVPLNWHVNALLARATGSITVGDTRYEFSHAPAIEDHFWGIKYPDVTIRLLAANFDDPDTSCGFLGGNLLLGPLEAPLGMAAFQEGGTLWKLGSLDLETLAAFWRGENGFWNIQVIKGNRRINALVMNIDGDPLPGFTLDGNGMAEGGEIRHNVVVNVDVLTRADGLGDWELLSTTTGTLAMLALGNPTPYQDF